MPERLTQRVLTSVAVVLVVALVGLTIVRATRAWPREAHLNYVEGIWISLAIDASQGTMYRPLAGPGGYGGTRYFPLFFALHGALIRAGLVPITAGYLLSAFSIVLFGSAVVVLLRRLGVDTVTSLLAAAVALACAPMQMALLVIRGDALPAALAFLGLSAVVGAGSLVSAAALLTLAFAAKSTAIYAGTAAIVFLVVSDRRRDAARLSVLFAVGIAATLAVMELVSGGRALATIAASASGGSGWASVLSAPTSFARILRRVPESTFFIQVAAAVMLVRLLRPRNVAEAGWIFALGAALVIYASPATIENHLIDLAGLSVIVVASLGAPEPRWRPAVTALLIVGGVAAGASALWRSRALDLHDLRASRLRVLEALGADSNRLFADNPMLPASVGAHTYLLDPYMFSVRVGRDPSALARLQDDLARRAFDAVVLEHVKFDRGPIETFPGETLTIFRRALLEHYQLDRTVENRDIYRPR